MFTLHSGRETNPGEGVINIRGIQLPPAPLPLFCPHGNSSNRLSRSPSVSMKSPHLSVRGYFFSGCFCFISIGENDIISVHGRKDISVRTAGREEEKKAGQWLHQK